FAAGEPVPAGAGTAAALAEAVSKETVMRKLKVTAALVLTVGLLGFGTALVGVDGPGPAVAPARAPAPLPRAKKAATDPETLRRQLEGTWAIENYPVGGRMQGGPGQKWETVRIDRGAWSQSCRVDGRELWTTPYVVSLGPKDASLVDMTYRGHQS